MEEDISMKKVEKLANELAHELTDRINLTGNHTRMLSTVKNLLKDNIHLAYLLGWSARGEADLKIIEKEVKDLAILYKINGLSDDGRGAKSMAEILLNQIAELDE